ncbi:S41 family peptidase [Aquimarina sp. ERC-38]|uniref:S41 family peptidase n=1 Tax=Aquimarina sp. ERC-38 TaxID=2949996 RepID=UPI002247DE62|nr:S41 family peptidase [Aquimarina sp. ERC-38]UZO80768.1 S41 family peptidase [Aquimarina sp. ERC-38]
MKKIKYLSLLVAFITLIACSNDDEGTDTDTGNEIDTDNEVVNEDFEVDDFIWQAMNLVYLYKADVSDLNDDKIQNQSEYENFLKSFDSPESLYDALQSSQDRFSFLTPDYVALEKQFSGISKSNGMEFGLVRKTQGGDDVVGFVRYVLPSTDAERKGIERGDFFDAIDGEVLTVNSNFQELFARDSYTVRFVDETNNFTPIEDINLTAVEYTENPIFISKTIDYKGQKIGYIMYNGFTGTFDEQLNDAFGVLKTDGVTDLILDLRYNGGGSVRTAIDLAAMITGQFTGDIFSKEIWNENLQAQFSSGPNGEENLLNRFVDTIRTGAPINKLELAKVHVLTTDRTASASELIINGLDPYITVVQIGETTTGKFQASATFYDSQNLGRENANPNHTYAIQPLIFKSANKDDITDFVDGLVPEVPFQESLLNLGTLGEVEEPFLNAALEFITTGAVPTSSKSNLLNETIGESKMHSPIYQKMYDNTKDYSFLLKD